MEFFKYLVSGITLGITEGVPVSSVGHALLFGHVFGISENFALIFSILHIGVLLAIVCAYYKTIFGIIKSFFVMLKNIFSGKFRLKNLDRSQHLLMSLGVGLIPVFLIFVPVWGSGTNILGVAHEFSDVDNMVLCGISFLINGILLKFGIDSLKHEKFKYTYTTADNVTKRWEGRMRLTVTDAVWCGVVQFISMIFPGMSHIGAVFSVGLIRGINKQVMLDYSFLLGFPSIVIMLLSEFGFAANFSEISKLNVTYLLFGILCSMIFGFLFIRIFNRVVKKNKVFIFSVYTMVLGAIMAVVGIFEQIRGINIFQGLVL